MRNEIKELITDNFIKCDTERKKARYIRLVAKMYCKSLDYITSIISYRINKRARGF